MTDLRLCKNGVGFAVLAAVGTTVALTSSAMGVGTDLPLVGCADIAVGALPFTDTGDTGATGLDCNGSPIANDFDPGITDTCPYSTSTSPEVFYSHTPTADGTLSVDLCGQTSYDTKTYILEDGTFNVVACNDDSCTAATGQTFVSQILSANVTAGTTYFIGVDGWQGAAGAYEVVIDAGNPCDIPCIDNEGDAAGALDCTTANGNPGGAGTNSDCATTPSSIACGDVICGEAGTWGGNPACVADIDCDPAPGGCDLVTMTCVDAFTFRDLDWYNFTLAAEADVTIAVNMEATPNLFLLQEAPDCDNLNQIFGFAGAGPCQPLEVLTEALAAGAYKILATPDFASAAACGTAYELSVTCDIPCPGDIDGDGNVGFTDLNIVLGGWGLCPTL